MLDAPVALFAYRRPRQLAKVLDALRALEPAVLYVFCDGPQSADDESAVAEARALVEAVDWTDARRVYRPRNVGLNRSIEDGLNAVFAEHDRAIVIEDDVCVAPEFGRFVTACLDAYADEPSVAAVTGLRYPFAVESLGSHPYDAFFAPRFTSWGWATWRRAWAGFALDAAEAAARVDAAGLDADALPGDVGALLETARSGRLHGGWDVCCALSVAAAGQEVVWSTWNMVVNIGFTEGTHAGRRAPAWQPRWEAPPDRPLRLPPVGDTESGPRRALLELLSGRPRARTRVARRLAGYRRFVA
jgi:hypothetical protein